MHDSSTGGTARSPAPSALRWTDILLADDTDLRALEAPRLTHAGFDWTSSREVDGLRYGPPMEGGPDDETRLELHRLLDTGSPEGVACAYWLGGSPYLAHLSSRGELLTVEDLEYVTLHTTLDENDEVAEETVQYPV